MTQYPHDHYRASVSADPTASSPAPADQGPRKGYFDDSATRLLLSLSPDDAVLHSGTYGNKELSVQPIKLSELRALQYDRRLLPFTPRNHGFLSHYIAMHEQNGQYPVIADTRRILEENLLRSVLNAQLACEKAHISLPNYALSLVPRLRYHVGGDERPFPYQFLVFFSPSANRMRGVRIGRVGAVLDAATNAAHAMVHGPGNWPIGNPVGVMIDVDKITEEDYRLLLAYRALGVPIEGEVPRDLDILTITSEDAKDLLIDKTLGKSAYNTQVPIVASDLNPNTGLDDDALDYAAVDPDYDEHGFNADGLAKTRAQRREEEDFAYMDEALGRREELPRVVPMEEDPAPPYVSTEPRAGESFSTTALQSSLEEPASGAQPQLRTPSSVVESIPSSEAVSAASSAPDVTAPRTRKSTAAAQRARNYRGPYTQPASSSSSSRSRPPLSRRSPSPPRRYSPPRRGSSRQYSPPRRPPYRRSPSPSRGQMRRRSPSPPAAAMRAHQGRNLPGAPGVRIIQTREQHRIIQDTDTGISALVPVMQISSAQMGLNLASLMQPVNPEEQRGRIGLQDHAPRSIDDSREPSGSRHLPRSRSPRRDYYSRPPPPSPSPRRSDYGSSQYSSRSGSRRSPPRRYNPPRRRSPRPASNQWRGNEPTPQEPLDPQDVWGESVVETGQGWGNPAPTTFANTASTSSSGLMPPPSSSARPSASGNLSTSGAGPSRTSLNHDE